MTEGPEPWIFGPYSPLPPPRREIADIGVAHLTFMYPKGPVRAAVSDDFRTQAPGTDALMIRNGGGERVWRLEDWGAGAVKLIGIPIGNGFMDNIAAFCRKAAVDSLGLRLVPRDGAGLGASPVWLYRSTRARDGGA